MQKHSENIHSGIIRRRLIVSGQVQGVGFRPFIYRIALEHGLTGFVGNSAQGVCIEVQGTPQAVADFCHALEREAPPLARLEACLQEDIPPLDKLPELPELAEHDFRIVASHAGSGHSVQISPDIALCADCRADMNDPANRRYAYPFTNCTNCGPRYTITRSIPYDRAATSMACFPQCSACRQEYENPANRRFHAQPNACPECGPQLFFVDKADSIKALNGTIFELAATNARMHTQDALHALADALAQGRIAAIKGLGGFHLACDAHNADVIALLRQRKQRPHKPLAVMCASLETARRYTVLNEAQALCLQAPECPVVLCTRNAELPEILAPDSPQLGVMLPYTPLHHELMRFCGALGLDTLVMTSGNATGDPICLGNREALERLVTLADVFLFHNRDILIRVDDSVISVDPPDLPPDLSSSSTPSDCGSATPNPSGSRQPEQSASVSVHSASILTLSQRYPVRYIRRARGFAPSPLALFPQSAVSGVCVMGTGAELKSTLCLSRGNAAFVSQHLGDMDSLAAQTFFEEIAAHLSALLMVEPQCLVHDLHPDFFSTRWARDYAHERAVPLFALQHHFAHIHAVLAEHPEYADKPVLGLALDGTGLGEDSTIWGGELLFVDASHREQLRLGRLRPFPLPGGDAATREPWRIAHALWTQCGFEPEHAPWFSAQAEKIPLISAMLIRTINSPLCSSCGRLFDAVSALLGLCTQPTYEGQAAILLEHAQHSAAPLPLEIPLHTHESLLELDSQDFFAQIVALRPHATVPQLAATFHASLARGLARMAARAASTHCRAVVLAGGVLHNRTLLARLLAELRFRKLQPLLPRHLPPNDGALSFGQVAWARRFVMG